MPLIKVPLSEVQAHPFTNFAKDWALVTAGTPEHSNTMTIGWGGLGTLWGRPVATVYIRPQRYTKQFVDANDRFTVSFYGSEHKRALGILGTKSGRDTDKVAEVGFDPIELGGSTAYGQAELILVCRKIYESEIDPEKFIDKDIDAEVYPKHDYHTVYIAEVEEAWVLHSGSYYNEPTE